MKYFTHLTSCNKANNRLQTAAFELLSAESNRLVEDPYGFIRSVERRIERLNVENPRCGPLHVTTHHGEDGETHRVWVGNHLSTLAAFAVYLVKEGENP